MTLYERRLQYLHDMIYYYGSDVSRRCVWGTTSYHIAPKDNYRIRNNKSPSGRFMKSKTVPLDLLSGSVLRLRYWHPTKNQWIYVESESILPMKIYSLGLNFLAYVDNLHDTDQYWNSMIGLSEVGQYEYINLVKTYCENDSFDPDREILLNKEQERESLYLTEILNYQCGKIRQ